MWTRSMSSRVLPPLGSSRLELERKIGRPDLRAAAHHQRALHGVLQFAHVARPVVAHQHVQASAEICGTGRLVAMQNLLRKWFTSSGMSSRRSRSGGRSMQKTCSR